MEIDVETSEGSNERTRMLRCYLFGLQWVLYYYYKGCQHWGFYYNYHYPPMISDIHNAVQLIGKKEIGNKDFDEWGWENKFFTPFQQLMTILPPNSIDHLLPHEYA